MEAVSDTQWWNPAYLLGKFMLSPTLGKRASAALIDLILVSTLQYWVSLVFGVYQPVASGSENALLNGDGMSLYVGQTATLSYFWLAITIIAYFTCFEALFGATPGKGLLRLQVMNLDGGRPSVRAILTRNVFRLVDTLPLFYIVGGLVAQSTMHEQRVGDIIASTTVVARETDTRAATGVGRTLLKLLLVGAVLAALVGGGIAFQYYERAPLIIQSWANANNEYPESHNSTSPTTFNCGPSPVWYPDGRTDTRPIIEYAVGAPEWGQGIVTYPIRVYVWNSATNGGQPPTTPNQVSMSIISPGSDVFDGHIRFTDFNPLNGGWRIGGGDMGCSPAK